MLVMLLSLRIESNSHDNKYVGTIRLMLLIILIYILKMGKDLQYKYIKSVIV